MGRAAVKPVALLWIEEERAGCRLGNGDRDERLQVEFLIRHVSTDLARIGALPAP